MSKNILVIDQGTTSTRAMIFSALGEELSKDQAEIIQYFPKPGWVEHDAQEIWQTTLRVCRRAIHKIEGGVDSIITIGITNQRETTILWNRATGAPIAHAIVWQDRRTAEYCHQVASEGMDALISQKTGLVCDPYFSATKIRWLLEHVPQAKKLADQGQLAFGTVDCFLLWHLTGGKVHATDITNASRTMLYDIEKQTWDQDLLAYFAIPDSVLPTVFSNTAEFGCCDPSHFGKSIPITGMIGDQQAALLGQSCLHPGMLKSTYGTGCFLVLNTGAKCVRSQHRMLTTIAYRLTEETVYALEGSIFIAGAVVQWLRDAVQLIKESKETQALAACLADNDGVYFVPAFTGLGAPYWDPDARGAIFGLTRDTDKAHLARAALESVCYQTHDLIAAIHQDGFKDFRALRVDGGMVHNSWLMQMLSDILQLPIEIAGIQETTAFGAAKCAGVGIGLWTLSEIERLWQAHGEFSPKISAEKQQRLLQGWRQAVSRVLTK